MSEENDDLSSFAKDIGENNVERVRQWFELHKGNLEYKAKLGLILCELALTIPPPIAMIKLFLENGVDPNELKFNTVMTFGPGLSVSQYVAPLYMHGFSFTPQSQDLDLLELFLSYDCNLKIACLQTTQNFFSGDIHVISWRPIHYFANFCANPQFLTKILSKPLDIDVVHRNIVKHEKYSILTEQTALHLACESNFFEHVRQLVTSGANVNMVKAVMKKKKRLRTHKRETPLHIAIRIKSEDMVSLLIDHGADTTIPMFNQGQLFSVWNLAESPAIMNAISPRWKMVNHFQQHPLLRAAIRTLLMVFMRRECFLPFDIQVIIFEFLSKCFFCDRNFEAAKSIPSPVSGPHRALERLKRKLAY